MRRLTVAAPIRTASAARLAAVFAAYVVGICVLLLRLGLVGALPGLAALAAGLVVAVLAIVLALVAFAMIWQGGEPGAGRAFAGLLIGAVLLAGPAALAARSLSAPPLVDVTTDAGDPPRFAARPGGYGAAYDPALAAVQARSYPKIHPLLLDLPPDDVQDLVVAMVKERKWRLVTNAALAPPDTQGRAPIRFPTGRVEAVARSPVLGLEDDVAVRLKVEDGKTRVDMRSASRFGPADLGANAERVAAFLEDLRLRAMGPPQARQ